MKNRSPHSVVLAGWCFYGFSILKKKTHFTRAPLDMIVYRGEKQSFPFKGLNFKTHPHLVQHMRDLKRGSRQRKRMGP